jgi:hypothetical protein
MASGLPGGAPKGVELIEHAGKGYAVKYRGEDARHPEENGSHHLMPDTMYQPPGTDAIPLKVLDAFLVRQGLPPDLIAKIEPAIESLIQQMTTHQFANSDTSMSMPAAEPEGDEGMGGMGGMMGGLPGGSQMAA